jgi:hypothetical protein
MVAAAPDNLIGLRDRALLLMGFAAALRRSELVGLDVCDWAIGLDPTSYSGHSLRAGFLTSAAQRGASIFKMMDVSRHRSLDMLSGYVRDSEFFHNHAGAGLL